jgi:NitT/TauT family transport system substrate-binding protein
MKFPNPLFSSWRNSLRAAWLAGTGVSLWLALSSCGSNAGTQTASTETTATGTTSTQSNAAPITIGYSDWPGWVAWDIADQQGFFKKRGANVKLVWFPVYTDSLNALAAGQVDANGQTWSDTMGPLSKGMDLKAVLVNDNSFGNDAMIAQPGFKSVKDLRGKRVATELGTCDHFLMLKALEANGMTEKDVQFTPIAVQDCPAAMLSKRVDAAVVWEPSRTKILKDLKGSTSIFDSSDIPGLIPDLLVMKGSIVKERPQDVQNIVLAWYDAIDWWRANPDKAVAIMAKRTGTSVADYKDFIMGTRIFSAPESLAALAKSDKVTSLFVSGQANADFLMKAKQIDKAPDFEAAIDPQFVKAAVAQGVGKLPPYDYSKKG